MNAETVSENDDTPSHRIFVDENEAHIMGESEWVELKKDLQSFLFLKENEDSPTFSDEVFFDWLEKNADHFNNFYQQMRKEKPLLLIEWWKESKDDDELNDVDFIQEWVSFKKSQEK